jgi:hypothetical protein
MNRIRFYTDEDMYRAIASQLRAAGFDAVSTPEAGRLGETDEAQLQWAAQQGRAIATFNVGDYARLHHEWMTQGRHHAGVIVSQQRPIGDVLRRLLFLGATLDADAMRDRLEYLSNWTPP